MPPYGLYSIGNTPEELLSEGYGTTENIIVDDPFDDITYRYQPAPYTGKAPFQTMYDSFIDFPSKDLSVNYLPKGTYTGNIPNQTTGIMQQAPTSLGFFDDNYGQIFDSINSEKDDEQVEYLPGQYSFKDKVGNLINKSGISSLLGLITGNPILGLINKGIGAFANRAKPAFNDFRSASTGAQFFQNLRDRRAREEAAARGAARQADLQRIQTMRAIRGDTGGGGNGGGIGSSVGGSASPGSAGPGGSDEMGSF